MMGDAVPQTPWDLSHSTRVDKWETQFPLAFFRRCRTMILLAWRIEQRRDATRAPRLPGVDGGFTAAFPITPLHHLRTPVFLSNRWGPPHFVMVAGTPRF